MSNDIQKWVAFGAFALQCQLGRWAAPDMIPTTEDRLAGDALVAGLKVRLGPVWAPHSPWLPVQKRSILRQHT